jgi:uncharacterized protein (DUF58 family)
VRYLREGEERDDPRDVHWPQTARQGRFIVRQRAADDSRDVLVVLDGSGSPPEAAFDSAVSEATGLALSLLSRGDRVGLYTGSILLRPMSGPGHRRALLTALALAEPQAAEGAPLAPLQAVVYVIRPRESPREAA